MSNVKIQIKSIWGTVLYENEKPDYTLAQAVRDANLRDANLSGANLRDANLRDADLRGADLRDANLRGANLRGADLRGADLRGANLRGANLRDANLRDADLRGADLRGADLRDADLRGADLRDANLRGANLRGADLRGADLRGIPFENLPTFWVNLCSRDILFVLEHLKDEVPYLKEKLLAGEVDGTQYEGDCACLVGSLANAKDDGYENVCTTIPYYTPDSTNPGETWFLNIKEGDKPADNVFSMHALKLCNQVLGLPEDDGLNLNGADKASEEVETVEIDGKKYSRAAVTERLKELEEIE